MVKVRPMELDDLDEVMVIENDSFSEPWTKNGFFTFFIRNDTLFLVAEEEGRILGYCGLILICPEGEITNVAVQKQARNRHIGSLLVEELEKRAVDLGIKAIYLEVRESNASAIALYEKYGFEKFGRRKNYYEKPTEDALVMAWKKPSEQI